MDSLAALALPDVLLDRGGRVWRVFYSTVSLRRRSALDSCAAFFLLIF